MTLELNLKIENNQNNTFFDEYRHYIRYNRKEQTVWVGDLFLCLFSGLFQSLSFIFITIIVTHFPINPIPSALICLARR